MSFRKILAVVVLGSGWLVAAWLWLQPMPLDEAPETQIPASPAVREVVESQPQPPLLTQIVQQWANTSGFEGATICVAVLDLEGKLLAGFNETLAMVPASSLKTLTTGAALELLGPDFVFETVLSASAAISTDGAVGGDLVLIGSGDPTLAIADLEELATAAVAAGLKSVSGRVIADARAFPEAGASDHWNWGDVGNAYGAGIYGLNIEHNRCTVRFNPGSAPGEPASFLGASIDLPGVQWTNLVGTGEEGSGDGVVIHSGPYSPLVTLRGTVPAGEPGFAVRGAIPDPPGVAAYLLDRALRARGVTLGAEPQTARITAAPEAPVRIAAHRSAPIRDFIPHLHAVSDNVEAQSLFLKMGGADAVRELWAKRGVEFAGLRLEDGSGLARASRIRPLDLARANHLTRRGPHGALFHESLSASRGGAVRSKGGAMSGVRADTGFFTREDGTELTYTIIANGLTKGADFWAFRDAVLDAVSST